MRGSILGDPMLDARIKSYETAFGMQMTMPQVLDLRKESDATLKLYGMERGTTTGFGWQCIVARRMIEQGVRFVELIDTGSSKNWDAHSDVHSHEPLARKIDQPIAGLLADLKSRGLLKDTLVVFTTEFGRTPRAEGALGRGHFNKAYSSWMAGGGIKGGMVYGKTDDLGSEHRGERMPCPRFSRHHFAVSGLRSHQADVPSRRPGLPVDGCGGECGERDSGVAPWAGAFEVLAN